MDINGGIGSLEIKQMWSFLRMLILCEGLLCIRSDFECGTY